MFLSAETHLPENLDAEPLELVLVESQITSAVADNRDGSTYRTWVGWWQGWSVSQPIEPLCNSRWAAL